MIKLIIAGSRTIDDSEWVFRTLDNLCEDMHIDAVHCGMARGIDLMGNVWADHRGIEVIEFPALWKVNGVHDRKAGFKRNQQMLDAGATHLIAIQDVRINPKGTNGTNHMINISKAKKICVQVVNYK